MLIQLSVKNFALIENITLDFAKGLNVLTGATGAGKSILIDALQLALGERMDMTQVRDRDHPCQVQAVFELEPSFNSHERIAPFLSEEDSYCILKRTVSPEGKSKCEVNGQIVNLSQLKEIGALLVDLHGQYDHQRIFDPESHREWVDAMAGSARPLLASYRELYGRYAELLDKKAGLADQQAGKDREMDLLGFQIKEIEEVRPESGEDLKIEEDRIRLAHAEKLFEITGRLLEALEEGDDAVSGRLAKSFRDLAEWTRIDPSAAKHESDMRDAQAKIEDLIASIREYQERLSFEPERLKEIEIRGDQLDKIKRKYGGSLAEALRFLESAKRRYDELENAEVYQKETDDEIKRLLPQLEQRAGALTLERRKAMQRLTDSVLKDLKDLGFRHIRFEGRLEAVDFGPQGRDRIEFLISANAGEPLKALALIASGGEASRIMLALKHALAGVDRIPTLIFDEIDANVGGRLGQCVGEKLKAISAKHQVLLITHLPQIASFADRHYKVQKTVRKGKTAVGYELLEGEARVKELAQMMSGERETAISKAHAAELLKSASL